MLPFFFRHYDGIVDHYFIHDNGSTDRTPKILESHPRVTVLPLVLEGNSRWKAMAEKDNEFWYCSRKQADWVVVCDIDEFFWHVDIRLYLDICRRQGITFLHSIGYQMVSDEFPGEDENLCQTIRYGVRDKLYDKPSFFNPDIISHSGFSIGRHEANPTGNVVRPAKNEIILLHYKHLGVDYVAARHADLQTRRREEDIKNQWAFHHETEQTMKRHNKFRSAAKKILPSEQGLVVKWKRWQLSRFSKSPLHRAE